MADIALIRGVSLYLGIKRKENKFFTTSLYKINRIIKEKTNLVTSETKEEML